MKHSYNHYTAVCNFMYTENILVAKEATFDVNLFHCTFIAYIIDKSYFSYSDLLYLIKAAL